MKIGYKLAAEGFGPKELVRQAQRAEEVGFAFVEISDHFHPWLDVQGHSPFAWDVLSAIAMRTTTLEIATGVSCPTVRYHPAIIAQAAATLAILSDDRFTLGIGAGERLNEHVVGLGFRGASQRHEMLREGIEIIRALWSGGYHSYEGKHLQLEDARVFDLPDILPQIIVAASGPQSLSVATDLGDGLFAVDPDGDLVSGFRDAKPNAPAYAEASLAWAPTVEAAVEAAHHTSRWGLLGWKVMAELPNPVNFKAAAATVRKADVEAAFGCGPDVQRHVEVVSAYIDAGFDHIALMNAGPDPDGFFDFFERELKPELDRSAGD